MVGHRHDFFVSGKILAQGLAVVFVLGHSTITPFYCFFISDPVRPRQSRSGPLRGGSAATRTGLLAIFTSLPLYSAARDGILWSDESGGVCAHLPNISALLYQNLDGLSSLYRAPGRFFSAQSRCPIGKTREKQGTPLRCTLFFVRLCPCHPLRDCSGAYAGPPPRRRVCVHAGGSPAYAGVPPERGVYVSIKKGGDRVRQPKNAVMGAKKPAAKQHTSCRLQPVDHADNSVWTPGFASRSFDRFAQRSSVVLTLPRG